MREHGSMEKYATWRAPTEKSETSAPENLTKREATLFEKIRHSGNDLMKVLAFVTAFSVLGESRALAKGDQSASMPEKPKSAESAKEMKRLDPEKISGPADTKAQKKNIIYSVDGKTLEILDKLDMSIEGNNIVTLRDPQHNLRYTEINGVTTDSVSVTSEISDSDSTVVITGKNSDGSVDVLRYLNGKFGSAESTAADSTGAISHNK